MAEQIAGMLGLVGVLSLLCQWLGWRMRLPAILPLLLCGLLLGPGLGIIQPEALLGDLLFPMISLGVAIILFEGALTLNFKEIRDHGKMVINLVSIGALVTWTIISVACHYLMGFAWELAILFGALVVVTGPTVIVPMLRSVRPSAKLGSILRWEGIVIDPIGALLAVLVYEYVVATNDPATHVLQAFGLTLLVGLGLGAATGWLLGLILKRRWIPHYLRNTAVLTIMLGVFVLSNAIEEESGLLTVTVMGILMANIKDLDISDIIEFKETLTVLMISALFILLAARLDSEAVMALGWGSLALLAVVLFIARPVSIWLCGIGTSLSSAEKWFLSWMAPRGIVAAAVSSLFAIKLQEKGFAGAELIVPLVFVVIIGTVVIQSLTASAWAKWLGVRMDAPQGVLIFGASVFSRNLAKILMDNGYKVLLADTNWDNIRLARMDNIPVYFGNPASEHAENALDLTGIGRALVISPYRKLNPLVNFYYQDVFGESKVFGLNNFESNSARLQMSESYRKRLCLFADGVSYAKIASQMSRGGMVKSTLLTENYTLADLMTRVGEGFIPLAWSKDGRLHIMTSETQLADSGYELIYLSSPVPESDASGDDDKD
ncbi:sodium:proton antiporter [Shewanella submarina]|uniref:Cation:proton antiporter n=1 Tax=Shewanella submarina TaxID=2016376 RepID=A0ABV7GJB7_9GAMM|nr:sodium:proton antiporter [Shewanella submarina]MCL1038205.1 sodium:proton antiporter [Shewanella submarina]